MGGSHQQLQGPVAWAAQLQVFQAGRWLDPVPSPEELRGDVVVALRLIVLEQFLQTLSRLVSLRHYEFSLLGRLVGQFGVEKGLHRGRQLASRFLHRQRPILRLPVTLVITFHDLDHDSILERRIGEGLESLVELLVLSLELWGFSLCYLVLSVFYHCCFQWYIHIILSYERFSRIASCCVKSRSFISLFQILFEWWIQLDRWLIWINVVSRIEITALKPVLNLHACTNDISRCLWEWQYPMRLRSIEPNVICGRL